MTEGWSGDWPRVQILEDETADSERPLEQLARPVRRGRVTRWHLDCSACGTFAVSPRVADIEPWVTEHCREFHGGRVNLRIQRR